MGDELIKAVAGLMKESARAGRRRRPHRRRRVRPSARRADGRERRAGHPPHPARVRGGSLRDGDFGSVGADDRDGFIPDDGATLDELLDLADRQALRAARHRAEVVGWGSRDLGVGRRSGPSHGGEGDPRRCAFPRLIYKVSRARGRSSRARASAPATDRRRAAPPGTATRGHPAARATRAARCASRRRSRPDTSGRVGLDQPRVSSIRVRTRGCRSESSRNTALKRPPAAPSKPTISLWSNSGSSAAKHGIFAFSLNCVLKRYAIEAVSPAADDLRDRVVQRARKPLRERVLGGVGPPVHGELFGMGGGDVDLGVQRLGDAAQRRHLERDHESVTDRPRLVATRERDHRHAVAACGLRELAAGRRDDPPRADRARGLVDRERLLRVARVARCTARVASGVVHGGSA